MSVTRMMPELQPHRGEPLEDACRRLAEECRRLGLSVHEPELANAQSEMRDLVRYFHVAGPSFDPGGYCMVFVSTSPWGHEDAVRFLNTYLGLLLDTSLRAQIGRPVFDFRSPYPLHPMLGYVFRDWPAGRLEAAALAQMSEEPLDEDSASALALEGRELVERHLGVRLELDSLETIGVLNDLILGELRTCADPALALQVEDYRPQGILSMLGAVLGELIRRAHPERVRWVSPPESLGGNHPVLEMTLSRGDQDEVCYIFPVDRLYHCYQEGQDRDLRTYYDVVIAQTLLNEQEGPELTGQFEDVAEQVFPVLKPMDWNARMDIESVELVPDGPYGTPLAVVAVDHPQRIAFLVRERLKTWGVGYESLMGRACANLARRSMNMAAHLEELEVNVELQVFRLSFDDYFNASRALLTDALYRAARQVMPQAEVYLLAVPNRDHLLLSAVQGREQFDQFQGIVRWFHERQPAPLSSVCFLLNEEGVEGVEAFEG